MKKSLYSQQTVLEDEKVSVRNVKAKKALLCAWKCMLAELST